MEEKKTYLNTAPTRAICKATSAWWYLPCLPQSPTTMKRVVKSSPTLASLYNVLSVVLYLKREKKKKSHNFKFQKVKS